MFHIRQDRNLEMLHRLGTSCVTVLVTSAVGPVLKIMIEKRWLAAGSDEIKR